MSSLLNVFTSILAYGDSSPSNNPRLRNVDWNQGFSGVLVENPLGQVISVLPGATLELFSGIRTTSIAGDTAFSIALNPVTDGVYRVTRTAGTQPVFRTDRGLALSGDTVEVTINNNATAVFGITTGDFVAAGVVAGDTMLIPNTSTGDAANVLSESNSGLWTVLAVAAKSLSVRRPAGVSFDGVAETVVLTASSQLQCFSAAGVQILDKIDISAGFSPVTRKTFVVSAVAPGWIEFVSGESLPLETGIIPGAAGVTFYTSAKRFLRIEVDQEAAIRFNGDTGNSNIVAPRTAATTDIGWIEKWGTVYQLSVVNRSPDTLHLFLITAE